MKTNPGPVSPRYQALLQLLRTADTVWDASRAFFGRWDLSPSQFNILNLLRLEAGGLSQTELGRQLIMHRSNVTGLVDRLEQRRLVARRDVAGDRRAYHVVLTPAGKRLLEEILPGYYKGAERVWEPLSAKRVGEVTTALETVAENARRMGAEQRGQSLWMAWS